MKFLQKSFFASAVATVALCAFVGGASAADVVHDQPGATAPYANSVMVPAGYNTYYISGSSGRGADTEAQTAATLEGLKAQLAKLGLTFGDVVQAHVYLAGDPNKNNMMDFAGMNAAWMKEFGTADQPNKPARAAFQIAQLAGRSSLVEIEFIAVKKAN